MSSDRICVVTGANKGIGFWIAKQVAESGLYGTVVFACRNRDRAEEAITLLQTKFLPKNSRVKLDFLPLELAYPRSGQEFVSQYSARYGSKCHCLVNNAAIAFKQADPTPFHEQTAPTLQTNLYGTLTFTEQMLPLLLAAGGSSQGTTKEDVRIVNVASMAGALNHNVKSPDLRREFTSENLTLEGVKALAQRFHSDVQSGRHQDCGWGNSNYGMSKCLLIAATKVMARTYGTAGGDPRIRVNACCPGYCKTDMSSNRGGQSPEIGARNASLLACMMPAAQCPTGVFVRNEAIAEW